MQLIFPETLTSLRTCFIYFFFWN